VTGLVIPAVHHVGMDDAQLSRFDRAATVADQVIAGVKADQLGDPTPCTEWDVRQLLNHVVGGTLFFLSFLEGGPPVDRQADHLGGDPSAAFRESLRRLRQAFLREESPDRLVPTPFGEAPIRMLVEMRTTEMLVHGWDIAKATGQSTDLDPELAESRIESFRKMRAARRGSGMFADEKPAPPGATAADRLAAAAGRAMS
jgi:uncharacterized protein (TIGR03086 family)